MPDVSTSVRGRRAAPVIRNGMRLHPARVTRIRQLSPHLRRITLVGERFRSMPYAGADQRVKLILPQAGQDAPRVDDSMSVMDMLRLPEDVRPIIRTYTIRHHRPAAAEVDIDFALHGDLGPAMRWAGTTCPGDRVAVYGPAAEYEPPEDTQWQLIAGDETALPAIGAIIESLRRYDRAVVLAEIPDLTDAQHFDTAADVDLRWLPRNGSAAHDSTLLMDAIGALELPDVPSYFWLAGESSIVTTIRRHLVTERGVSRGDVTFTGYWRHGVREDQR